MQKLQDSVFSLVKTKNLSPSVFSYLQPTDDKSDTTPLGGIFVDTKYGWLALGPKFCVIDLRTGLKVAAWTFGGSGNKQARVWSVVELPSPLTERSHQLLVSVETDDNAGLICVFHVNGSQILHVIKTKGIVTNLSVSDNIPEGPFACFDGVVFCGTNTGGIFIYDLNKTLLLQALNCITLGNEEEIRTEACPVTFEFLPINNLRHIQEERDNSLEDNKHLAVALNDASFVDNQYLFKNPDGSTRMKAKIGHVHVSAIQYVQQLGSVAVGFNFGAFQLWNLMSLCLEFSSQVNVECLPVTHFGYQEPCDDPRACSYLWVIYSVIDRFEEEQFPLAVMYALNYHNKQLINDNVYLYDKFISSKIVFQLELSTNEGSFSNVVGGKCVACHTYSLPSSLAEDDDENILNLCQVIWECWAENASKSTQYGMLVFDLDQWYKAQMPVTYHLESSPFMSAVNIDLPQGDVRTLDMRLTANSLMRYTHPNSLEEHFYPNSLQYKCTCLTTSETSVISTMGIQRQIINGINEVGPTILLNPTRLYMRCVQAGLTPLYLDSSSSSIDEQRCYLLSVALEARLSCFLKRCAHDWAAGAHANTGCTLNFIVDWSWQRALDLKHNAKELIGPLFTSSSVPDWNIRRCLEHCVRQLTSLSSLLDAVLTKCCNLIVPDALSEIEEKFKGIGTVALYFQVVQWFLNVGLLPERQDMPSDIGRLLGENLVELYQKRRMKLHRLLESVEADPANTSCPLLYVDQLIERECGGNKIHETWRNSGSKCGGLYPPPSLYSLLRLYLMPDIAEENKHSLVLYLLLDYCMLYDERMGYEGTIKRLMQFPTMFGLSNTAIKATQAFWHLDHREFDFALDQLQCLTGNTLSPWQHHVVLSSLLAQKKTQAALQYLHVRKPVPVQSKDSDGSRLYDHNKLEDWQSCCDLYLARSLVFEALDVIRMVAHNCYTAEEKINVMDYFFKSCRNTGQLSKILNMILLPYEEEIFIRYLEHCNEEHTSDILVMYLLQHARYIEAQQYNKQLRHGHDVRQRKDKTGSQKSLETIVDRDNARDTLVDIMCASQPAITHQVLQHATSDCVYKSPISKGAAPKPLSVYVEASSPKNTFTYRSTFIQDTIENASETWIKKPVLRRGMKRALHIEDTPFICTPKLNKTSTSIFSDLPSDQHTPAKRQKLDFSSTPKVGNPPSNIKLSAKVVKEMESLLEMPEVQDSPPWGSLPYNRSMRDGTPQSILKTHRYDDDASSMDSKYLCESDDDAIELQSNHTYKSDTSSKQLQFSLPSISKRKTIPRMVLEEEDHCAEEEQINDDDRSHPLESPPKKLATERIMNRKSYKDNVRSRKSLSSSINSSLSDDPSLNVESIADIPFNLVNRHASKMDSSREEDSANVSNTSMDAPIRGRRSLVTANRNERRSSESPDVSKQIDEDTPIIEATQSYKLRSRPRTTENKTAKEVIPDIVISESDTNITEEDSGKLPTQRNLRSRSRTPEVETEPQSSPRNLRSRSKTPERETSRPVTPKSATKARKSLSRIVLEHNAFKSKNQDKSDLDESENTVLDSTSDSMPVYTPLTPVAQPTSLLDVSYSPIVNKSVLQTPSGSLDNSEISEVQNEFGKSIMRESLYEKSVLKSYRSSVADDTESNERQAVETPTELSTMNLSNSVLRNVSSLMTSDSDMEVDRASADDVPVESKPQAVVDKNDDEEILVIDSDSEEPSEEDDESGSEEGELEPEEDSEEEEESTLDEDSHDDLDEEDSDSDNAVIIESNSNSAQGIQEEESDSLFDLIQENDVVVSFLPRADSVTQDILIETAENECSLDSGESGAIEVVTSIEPVIEAQQLNDNKSQKPIPKKQNAKTLINTDDSCDTSSSGSNRLLIDENSSEAREREIPEVVPEKSIQDSLLTDDNSGLSVDRRQSISTPTTSSVPETKTQIEIDVMSNAPVIEVKENEQNIESDVVDAMDVEKPTERTPPKRSRSVTKKEKRTPTRAKRADSNASDKEESTVIEITPSRRLRTPSVELPGRRIMTRRASKELSESILEEEDTPSRRTRSRSKTVERDIKEALDTSKEKSDSKVIKSRRRSILANKMPDLGVIPEDATETKTESSKDIIKEYVQAGRLTRNQKQTLSSWLDTEQLNESSPMSEEKPRPRRRNSRAGSTSTIEGSPASSRKGTPTVEETETQKPKSRMSRAMSETKVTTKPKVTRRTSTDAAMSSQGDTPTFGIDSPRTRRACFQKAVEALTPRKGRAASVDKWLDNQSNPGSPVAHTGGGEELPVTPGKRNRRATSTQSNGSQKPETPRRAKKN